MAVRAIRATYINCIAPAMARMAQTNDVLSAMRLKDISRRQRDLASNIFGQGVTSLAFFGVGGVSQALAPCMGKELGGMAKVAGRVLFKLEGAANAFNRSNEGLMRAGIEKERDFRKQAADKLDRQASDAEAAVVKALNELGQGEDAQFHLK